MKIRPVLTLASQMRNAIAGLGNAYEHENETGKP